MTAADRFARAREGGDGLNETLRLLRRRWPVIALVVVVCVGFAVVRRERSPKSYEASSSVSFQNGTLSDAALQVQPGGSAEPQREANTETLVAHSPEVAEAVRKELNLKATGAELLNQVKVEPAANADVLNIVAKTGDPLESARLANAFARQYIAFRTRSQLTGISTAQRQLQEEIAALPPGSPERAGLQQSVQRLGELRAVAGGGANIIGLATPSGSPTGLSLSTTVIMGLLVGLAISLSLVFLLEALDRRVKTIDEFEHEYRLPALVSVPQSSFGARRAKQREERLEPYRILRSALDFAAVTRPLHSLLVTSAVSGEGKTTVSVDLGHVIALAGRSVALVELDLRRPTFAEHFGIDNADGLTTALVQGSPLAELMIKPFPDLPDFAVLPAGPLPHNPSELLGSVQVGEIISELMRSYDMVIMDAPPLLPVADAQVLLNSATIHAAVLVARAGKTKREEVRQVRAILDRHKVEAVGVVVTGLRDAEGYGYQQYVGADPVLDVGIDTLPRRPSASERRRLSF
jgi:capsular exopolysaccharide synthesis family protein